MEIRLDLLVMKKTGFSREYAGIVIENGDVKVNGKTIKKPGAKIADDSELIISAPPMKYVSRGGYKLEGALDEFGISVEGLICGDIGASTGGFTDCMLQRGARRVYAIDVGSEQLAHSLRCNGRVISMENVNINNIQNLPEFFDFIAIDVSFVSITKIIESAARLLSPNGGGKMICLIKPQFEVGRQNLKKGIVRDRKLYCRMLEDIRGYFEDIGLNTSGCIESPVKGKDGNTEFLLNCTLKRAIKEEHQEGDDSIL